MKKQLFVLLTFLLTSCGINSSQSESIIQDSLVSNDTFEPYAYKTKISEYDFSDVTKSLSNSYSNHTLKVEEKNYFENEDRIDSNYALIEIDNVSSQTTFPG